MKNSHPDTRLLAGPYHPPALKKARQTLEPRASGPCTEPTMTAGWPRCDGIAWPQVDRGLSGKMRKEIAK